MNIHETARAKSAHRLKALESENAKLRNADTAFVTNAFLETIAEWKRSTSACSVTVCHVLEELLTRIEQDITNDRFTQKLRDCDKTGWKQL